MVIDILFEKTCPHEICYVLIIFGEKVLSDVYLLEQWREADVKNENYCTNYSLNIIKYDIDHREYNIGCKI